MLAHTPHCNVRTLLAHAPLTHAPLTHAPLTHAHCGAACAVRCEADEQSLAPGSSPWTSAAFATTSSTAAPSTVSSSATAASEPPAAQATSAGSSSNYVLEKSAPHESNHCLPHTPRVLLLTAGGPIPRPAENVDETEIFEQLLLEDDLKKMLSGDVCGAPVNTQGLNKGGTPFRGESRTLCSLLLACHMCSCVLPAVRCPSPTLGS